MPVRYNDSADIRPGPLVDINKQYVRDTGGNVLYADYTFTLTGIFIPPGEMSGNSNANLLSEVITGQESLRNIFSGQGKRLEIAPFNGAAPVIDAYCDVESINFEKSTWTQRCDYVVVLKSKKIENEEAFPSGTVGNTIENWNITEQENGAFAVSHNVEAQGLRLYGATGLIANPLDSARNYCYARISSINPSGQLTLPINGEVIGGSPKNPVGGTIASINATENYWNYSTTETSETNSYIYRLTESFIYNPAGNTKETWSATVSQDANQQNRYNAQIRGTIVGYTNLQKNYTVRIGAAKYKWDSSVKASLYSRLLPYIPAGITLNAQPLANSVTYDVTGSTLSYDYSYIAGSGSIFPNAIEESLSITDTGPSDIFAQIPVPGRVSGPVVQYMNTSTLPERSVNISITVAKSPTFNLGSGNLGNYYYNKPNVDFLINQLIPSAGYYYITRNVEDWNPLSRQFNKQVSWTLQSEGVKVSGIPINGGTGVSVNRSPN